MKELIKKLIETPGPSGSEHVIREVIRKEVEGLADEVRVDALGNLIVRKGVKAEGGMRVMISAHIDEIGVMVTHVDENGFARFIAIGGVAPHTCLGGRVWFMNGVRGVIGVEKIESMDKIPGLENFYIDTGATSRENCPVKVGDVGGFERPMLDLGARLVGKSMDDRVAAAVLIESLRQLKETPNEVYYVFSVQEEVGLRGATTAAFGVAPEVGFAVDVTRTGDTPKSAKMEVSLGKGAAVKVRDSSFIADPRVVNWMVATAEANGIPYQMEVLERGGTDGYAIQIARAGAAAGCVSVPCRYIHSPSEMVDYQDVLNVVKLVTALVANPIKL